MGSRLTYGEVDGFITLLLVACEDASVNDSLERILSIPDPRRGLAIRVLVERLRAQGAPACLQSAFVCLLDDQVAEQAYQVIFKCRRA
jgi:hypothetical protein